MGRRRGTEQIKTALGGSAINEITKTIHIKIADEVHALYPCPVTEEQLVRECVPEHVRDILHKARQYKTRSYSDVTSGHIGKFAVDYDRTFKMLAPDPKLIEVPEALSAIVNPWERDVMTVLKKWALVLHVAKWFDKNASVGAMRYYWPSIMPLLPPGSTGQQRLHEASMDKYKEPPQVAKMLPLCRETATVVASGQVLPERPVSKTGFRYRLEIGQFTHRDYTGRDHLVEGIDNLYLDV